MVCITGDHSHGTCGQLPSSKSLIRVPGTILGKVSWCGSVAVLAVIASALHLEMTHSTT